MSAHTPGPWTVGFNDGSGPEYVLGFAASGAGKSIAKLRWGCSCCEDRVEESPLTDEEAANARLIAAAPELLAALSALVKKTEQRDNPADQGVSSHDDAMEAARAAIAKAEGK